MNSCRLFAGHSTATKRTSLAGYYNSNRPWVVDGHLLAVRPSLLIYFFPPLILVVDPYTVFLSPIHTPEPRPQIRRARTLHDHVTSPTRTMLLATTDVPVQSALPRA